MNYNTKIILAKNEKITTFLNKKIREYNDKNSNYHREVRKDGAVQPINIVVSDGNENWIGGINADVYWNWIEIHKFWIHEDHRGKGLGSQILNTIENMAIEKGAEKALLTTYDFQARTFYEGKGYKVVGEIKDYPPGSSFYTMVKILKIKSNNPIYTHN